MDAGGNPTERRERAIAGLVSDGLRSGGAIEVEVISGSMAPLVAAGDRVSVRGVEPEGLRPGDIVVVCQDDGWLTHRFVCSVDDQDQLLLITKGDRALDADKASPAAALLGRVVAIRRRSRELDLGQGLTGLVVGTISAVSLWETRLSLRTRSRRLRRVAHAVLGLSRALLARLAWLTGYSAML